VEVSSENASTDQLGIKAIDGYIDGYPGDYTREWATLGEQAGAWITLSWTQDYEIDSIILTDRPNSADHILSGTLSFSDGSSMDIGPLTNDGSGDEITFPSKIVSWVSLTITEAQGRNIGLAEFEVLIASP
jgi:hypothetical protein